MTDGDWREKQLADVFVALADTLEDGHGVIDTLTLLVDAAVQFTGACAAGILLADAAGELHVVASTGENSKAVEDAQLGTSEGPCFDAFRTGQVVDVDDIAHRAEEWPAFCATAIAAGFVSAHAVPLRVRGTTIGSLNLFSKEGGRLDEHQSNIARALAQTATIGILQQDALAKHARLAEQLQAALDSRIVLEQAKGALANELQISVKEAFEVLRTEARRRGMKLHDVAQQVADRQLSS
ncbi:GAF and ANTAR domain-containing protein [Frondihabitans cladoniiphilus]|uniref:GAF and ANTAR domain-containing protein n=1 Tax=Frondihabitans cladoniiphilus TaxID=715785 RepID=A0ABP8W2L7_9MICO